MYFLAYSKKNTTFACINRIKMDKESKDITYINRLKVVLAEKHLTNKWLAAKLGKDPGTVSKWCTNSMQPNLEMLREIALCLNVEMSDLLWSIKEDK